MEKDQISITIRLHCDPVIAISITQYEVDHWGAMETRSAQGLSSINYHDSTHPHVSSVWASLQGSDWPHHSSLDPPSAFFYLNWSSSTSDSLHRRKYYIFFGRTPRPLQSFASGSKRIFRNFCKPGLEICETTIFTIRWKVISLLLPELSEATVVCHRKD